MNSASQRHYPAYHTVIDSFDYMERFVDPSSSAHVSLTQLTADVLLQMASSPRLPVDVRELADTLEMEYDSLQQDGMDRFTDLLRTSHLFRQFQFRSSCRLFFIDVLCLCLPAPP